MFLFSETKELEPLKYRTPSLIMYGLGIANRRLNLSLNSMPLEKPAISNKSWNLLVDSFCSGNSGVLTCWIKVFLLFKSSQLWLVSLSLGLQIEGFIEFSARGVKSCNLKLFQLNLISLIIEIPSDSLL
uniref:hypothetical protein n=1 Tax=Pappia fissilis TaxID=1040649 RepID=UPI002A7EB3C3|nr:hypothetical protein UYP79_mgp007 [Pappia fissilis]WOX61249.1 hypothetical protein [Pappia fissilis]